MTSQADKNRRNAYSRSSVKKKMREVLGEDVIVYDLEVEGVEPFHIEHPFFRTQETKDALEPLENDDEEGIVRVLLGDDYDRFIEAGGTDDEISQLMVNVQLETNDSLQGKATRR
jgi:hypothetical protein